MAILRKIQPVPVDRKYTTWVVVTDDGREIGLVEKWRDMRSTTNPYKAFAGIGIRVKFIKAFYKEDGGKQAAINAVLNAGS